MSPAEEGAGGVARLPGGVGGTRRPKSNGPVRPCAGSVVLLVSLLLEGAAGSREPRGTGSWVGTCGDHTRPRARRSVGGQHTDTGGAPGPVSSSP